MIARRNFLGAAAALASATLLQACITTEPTADVVGVGYQLAEDLTGQLSGKLPADAVVLATTFTPADRGNAGTPFGRILGEHVASRFTRAGFRVVETRLRDSIEVNGRGRFALSDDVASLARQVYARAVIVGTYVDAPRYALVNARVIDVETGTVLAAADAKIDVSRHDRPLLRP